MKLLVCKTLKKGLIAKSTTRHIATRFKIDSASQIKNGQVVKRPVSTQ